MLKKISALLLALAMVMSLTSVAWAADNTADNNTYSGSGHKFAVGVAGKTKIPLIKSIVFVNVNGSDVYEPNITFSYAVEPASIEESTYTVTDSAGHVAYVHPGVPDGVSGVDIPFGIEVDGTDTDTVTASAAGTEFERTRDLTVDLSKFTKPGIYRYKITETSNPAAVTDVGLTARTEEYNPVRFLDVYIHYADHDENPETPEILQMYGAVIFKSTAADAGQDNIIKTTEKTTGYEPSATSGDLKDDDTVDRYTTYDIVIKKVVDGSMADTTNEFPFYVSVTNSISGAKFTYTPDASESITGANGSGTTYTLTSDAFQIGANSKQSSLTLKHNDSITLTGVPSKQTDSLAVVVNEFNNTYDAYVASVAAANGDITITPATAMPASTGSAETSSFAIKTNDTANQTITVTNKLDEISPTGVVMRVAPYMLILAAGVTLLLISRRRKAVVEE